MHGGFFFYYFLWVKFKGFIFSSYICSGRTLGASIFQTVYTSHYIMFLLDIMFSFADLFLYQVRQMKFPFWKLLPWLWEGISSLLFSPIILFFFFNVRSGGSHEHVLIHRYWNIRFIFWNKHDDIYFASLRSLSIGSLCS